MENKKLVYSLIKQLYERKDNVSFCNDSLRSAFHMKNRMKGDNYEITASLLHNYGKMITHNYNGYKPNYDAHSFICLRKSGFSDRVTYPILHHLWIKKYHTGNSMRKLYMELHIPFFLSTLRVSEAIKQGTVEKEFGKFDDYEETIISTIERISESQK